MKRLTVDTQIPFCDIAQCASYQGGPYCPDGKCDQRRVYEKLREYERTGKEPREIASTAPAIEVSQIRAYLQQRLDEWDALGDRKWEPANMWGYNFIMACFDDLNKFTEKQEEQTP